MDRATLRYFWYSGRPQSSTLTRRLDAARSAGGPRRHLARERALAALFPTVFLSLSRKIISPLPIPRGGQNHVPARNGPER